MDGLMGWMDVFITLFIITMMIILLMINDTSGDMQLMAPAEGSDGLTFLKFLVPTRGSVIVIVMMIKMMMVLMNDGGEF